MKILPDVPRPSVGAMSLRCGTCRYFEDGERGWCMSLDCRRNAGCSGCPRHTPVAKAGEAVVIPDDGNYELVDCVRRNFETAPVSQKLKALLAIAARVQENGKHVTSHDIERARAEGATDLEIHDTVLIAAAFCMFNRYVDGLATVTPTDEKSYDRMGQRLPKEGYVSSSK